MSEWKEYKIKDLGLVVTGKTPSSKFPEEFGFDMPFITPSDYKYYGKWAEYSERGLSKNGVKKLQNKVLPIGSVLVTCIGSDMGKVVLNKVPVITNQQVNSIIPNQKIVTTDFLYYKIIDCYETLRMYGQAGSAVPIVNKGDFEEIILEIPEDIEEQKSIASILSSLDDKIDLLHRQNKTLEALAETLFRQWFVEEAEEGWETTSLFDVVELVGGGTPKTEVAEYWDGNIQWISAKDITTNYKGFITETEKTITELGLENSSTKILPKYATVISARGTVGKYCLLAEDMAFSQSNYGIKPKYKDCYFFTYLLVASSVDELQAAAYGSVFDTITTNTFKEHKIQMPPETEIQAFEKSIKPYFEKMLQNNSQIRTLTRLRDTLLPKLMSGEVRVKNT